MAAFLVQDDLGLRLLPARLTGALSNSGDRPHYFRGNLRGEIFTVSGRQESHALFGLSRANALLRVEPGAQLAADAAVRVEVWD